MFAPPKEALEAHVSQPVATLVLADHNPEESRSLAVALTQLGYRVIKVIDGQQLLSLVDTFSPDVILIDSQLTYTMQADYSTANVSYTSEEPPKPVDSRDSNLESIDTCDGYTLCNMLAQGLDTEQIPVILLNTSGDSDARLRSLQANAWDYIAKPPQIAEIHLQIQNIINRTRRGRRCEEQRYLLEKSSEKSAEELNTERAKRRGSEEKNSHLLETIRVQNYQLQLLTSLTLENAAKVGDGTKAQRIQFQDYIAIIHQYIEQLTALALNLQDDSQQHTVKVLKEQLDTANHTLVASPPTANVRAHQRHRRAKSRSENNPEQNHHRSMQLNQLSTREYDILIYLVEGNSYQEIAEHFQISPSTVRSYRSRIMQKLGLSNSTEMIKLAVRYGLITIY